MKRIHKVYDSYGLYEALYGRSQVAKFAESYVYALALAQHLGNRKRATVLELFAGAVSYYRRYIPVLLQDLGCTTLLEWKTLDSGTDYESQNLVADVFVTDLGTHDVVLSPYYGLNSTAPTDFQGDARDHLLLRPGLASKHMAAVADNGILLMTVEPLSEPMSTRYRRVVGTQGLAYRAALAEGVYPAQLRYSMRKRGFGYGEERVSDHAWDSVQVLDARGSVVAEYHVEQPFFVSTLGIPALKRLAAQHGLQMRALDVGAPIDKLGVFDDINSQAVPITRGWDVLQDTSVLQFTRNA